jgi:hypothetical protein
MLLSKHQKQRGTLHVQASVTLGLSAIKSSHHDVEHSSEQQFLRLGLKTVRTEMDLPANKSQNDFKMSKFKNKDRCMEQINSFLTMCCMSKTGLSF